MEITIIILVTVLWALWHNSKAIQDKTESDKETHYSRQGCVCDEEGPCLAHTKR